MADGVDYRVHYSSRTSVHRAGPDSSFSRSPLYSRVQHAPQRARTRPRSAQSDHDALAALPLDLQEALIIEDLLSVLMGIEGTYIVVHPDYVPDDPRMQLKGARFVVSHQLDASLRDFVARILPLSTYFTAISSFIELRGPLEYGLVNHALCAALRDMLKDYYILLAQLEHAFNTLTTFTLQQLWLHVHPTLHTLSLMYALIEELAETPEDENDDDSDLSLDEEDAAKAEALGIASGVKAVLSQLDGDGGIIKGGEVVAILWNRMSNMGGDPDARNIYGGLLRRASRPYAEALDRWITSGELYDPHGELMVKESRFINRGTLEQDYTDEYWERRYTLRDGSTLAGKTHQAGVPRPRKGSARLPGGACIPPPLETWKHKILLAGKYLNVIRECGIEVARGTPKGDDENPAIGEEKFYKGIETAYTHANQTLLKLLLEDQQLILRLRTMRHFFFLCQSSFLTQFLDLSASELRKSARSASIVKLQSLLDLALKDDSNPDLFKEDIKVSMATTGLYDWLLKVVSVSGAIGPDGEGNGWDAQGMDAAEDHGSSKKDREGGEKEKDKKPFLASDALTLDYSVKFPLSLVLSRKTILRYQLLFRFLLHLKHVELALGAMWAEHTQPVWRSPASAVPPELERWRTRVFVLRARMLAFVQQILAFATSEVLEPHWRALEAKLARVTTVDQLLRDHIDFLDTCLKECMLTSAKLLRAYSRLVVTCSTFAVYTTSFTKSATQALAAMNGEPDPALMEKRWEFLNKFETNFNHWLKVFIDCVSFYSSTDNIQLLALVVRLNSVQTASGS